MALSILALIALVGLERCRLRRFSGVAAGLALLLLVLVLAIMYENGIKYLEWLMTD